MIWIVIDYFNGHPRSNEKVLAGRYHLDYPTVKPTYEGSGGWALRNDIHEWLIVRDQNYQLGWDGELNQWSVGIEDPKTAMLFKLTWV